MVLKGDTHNYDHCRELNHLRDVVTKISRRSNMARSFLYDVDIQAITTCTNSIRAVYDRVEVWLSLIPGVTPADSGAG